MWLLKDEMIWYIKVVGKGPGTWQLLSRCVLNGNFLNIHSLVASNCWNQNRFRAVYISEGHHSYSNHSNESANNHDSAFCRRSCLSQTLFLSPHFANQQQLKAEPLSRQASSHSGIRKHKLRTYSVSIRGHVRNMCFVWPTQYIL